MKIWQVFLVGLILFELIADVFVKHYSLSNKTYLAIIGIGCYIIANVSWVLSMRLHSSLAISANIFLISTGVIATIIGVGFFNEVITSNQIPGIMLGVVALYLILI